MFPNSVNCYLIMGQKNCLEKKGKGKDYDAHPLSKTHEPPLFPLSHHVMREVRSLGWRGALQAARQAGCARAGAWRLRAVCARAVAWHDWLAARRRRRLGGPATRLPGAELIPLPRPRCWSPLTVSRHPLRSLAYATAYLLGCSVIGEA